MNHTISPLIQAIKQARQSKKISQRSLAAKMGIPQSHLSKIESGNVDVRLSSLIELARTLELELMLVPRTVVVPVSAIIHNATSDHPKPLSAPAYQLDGEE